MKGFNNVNSIFYFYAVLRGIFFHNELHHYFGAQNKNNLKFPSAFEGDAFTLVMHSMKKMNKVLDLGKGEAEIFWP